MITAPFNFVPLSEKVFFPDWAEEVSHDVPFGDGESGVIDITITAKSPIFIRDHENPEQFCSYNGEYYIPGSSIKGMVRNILEIMSFSKIGQFDDDTYAFRDLNNQRDYMSQMKPTNTYCGWLKKRGNRYFIEDCRLPGRIRLDKIDSVCSARFNSNFDEKKDDNKTAEFKYELFSDIDLPKRFTHNKNHNGRDVYIQGNDKEGTVVFTGQPSKRKEGKEPSGKIYEFIFFDVQEDIEIDERVFDNFKSAYFDNKRNESLDWKYWKVKLENGENVPVFFQKSKDSKIKHFGLSYLYKLPYDYSIKDAIESVSKDHLSEKLDLAQTIFGYIDEKNKKALKGRVQFSHFKADSRPEKFKSITTVLGSPRASYYPIYIKQDYKAGDTMVKGGEYNTLMKKNGNISVIAGRKRYPLHQNIPNPEKYDKSVDSATTFNSLGSYKSGEFDEFTFSGKLRYHNIKKAELGAIISALTFHGNSDEFYHSIGMAKPLGFGKVEISLSLDVQKQIKALQEYESLMQSECNSKWLESEQIRELFMMASKNLAIDQYLKYLVLDPTNKRDDFREKKSDKEYLPPATTLSKSNIRVKSILDQGRVDRFLEKEEMRQNVLQEEKSKALAQNELLDNTPERTSKKFKGAIKNYVQRNITLPYYQYEDLKKVFEGKEDDIVADDIYNAYIDLSDKESFKPIEKLLLKREQNNATPLELAELYKLLLE